MELSDIRIFERSAREGSISRAAAALHMAQPAVSERLQRLEAEIGRPLFRRHHRGVALTEAGTAFLDYAQRILRLVEEGTEAARSVGGAPARISLAAPPSLNAYFLPPLLRRLSAAGCEVSARDAHSQQVIQMLLDGAVHAGFVLGAPSQPGIRQRIVRKDRIVCVMAPGHPLAKRSYLQLADLRGHAMIEYKFSSDVDRFLDVVGGNAQGRIRTSPAESVRSLLLGGDFFAFMPHMTVAADLHAGSLIALPVTDMPSLLWEVALVYRDRKTAEPAVATLLEAVTTLWG